MQGTWCRWLSVCSLVLTASVLTPWASASDQEPTISTPVPTRWLPHKRGECRKASRSKYCTTNGPRRTPEPYGEEAYVADGLGLGTLETAQKLLAQAPDPHWVSAIDGLRRNTMLWPVERGSFGRGFGYTRSHRPSLRHDGIDIGAPAGELVRSVNDGIVAYSDNGVTGYGNMVMVVHKDASVTFYCHHRANYVFAGQQVKRGQVLGEVGMTGIARGPHLHFEYHVGGRPRDPMRLMVGRPSRDQVREMLLEI